MRTHTHKTGHKVGYVPRNVQEWTTPALRRRWREAGREYRYRTTALQPGPICTSYKSQSWLPKSLYIVKCDIFLDGNRTILLKLRQSDVLNIIDWVFFFWDNCRRKNLVYGQISFFWQYCPHIVYMEIDSRNPKYNNMTLEDCMVCMGVVW